MPARPLKRNRRRRWIILGGVALLAFLYYKPLRAYYDTRSDLAARKTEVARLRADERALEARVSRSATLNELAHQARTLGYVKPGERLVIVKGVESWRRGQNGLRATIVGNG